VNELDEIKNFKKNWMTARGIGTEVKFKIN